MEEKATNIKQTIAKYLAVAVITVFTAAGVLYYSVDQHYILWGFIDTKGNFVITPRYLKTLPFNLDIGVDSLQEGVIPVCSQEHGWGVIDRQGRYIIEPQKDFHSIAQCRLGKIIAVKTDGYKAFYGAYSKHGEIIFPFEYDEIHPPREGFFLLKKNGEYGYISEDKTQQIDFQFSRAAPFFEGLACVKKDDKYGYIDSQGNWKIAPQFEYAGPFSEGLAQVGESEFIEGKKKIRYGYIDIQGNLVIPKKFYTFISRDFIPHKYLFTEGRAKFYRKPLWGLIDRAGNIIADAKYARIESFQDGLALAQLGERCGYMGINGKFVIACGYQDGAKRWHEGLIAVKDQEKWGFVNTKGKLVIPHLFDSAGGFHEGLAVVEISGEFGYINTSGEWVISPQFSHACAFSDGIAKVSFRYKDFQKYFQKKFKDF